MVREISTKAVNGTYLEHGVRNVLWRLLRFAPSELCTLWALLHILLHTMAHARPYPDAPDSPEHPIFPTMCGVQVLKKLPPHRLQYEDFSPKG